MALDDADLIGPDDVAFTLELTPGQLKIVYAAVKAFRDDFGHNEPQVNRVTNEVLAKLPDEASIRRDQPLRGSRPGGCRGSGPVSGNVHAREALSASVNVSSSWTIFTGSPSSSSYCASPWMTVTFSSRPR